jgi:transcription elongation GreA/GreB family factor
MREAADGAHVGGGGPSDGQRVGVGSRVLVFDGYGEVEFAIVADDGPRGARERDIPARSPLGKALIGRRVGEQVIVRTRGGIHFVRIRRLS